MLMSVQVNWDQVNSNYEAAKGGSFSVDPPKKA